MAVRFLAQQLVFVTTCSHILDQVLSQPFDAQGRPEEKPFTSRDEGHCVEEGGVPKDPTGFHSHSGGLVSFKALHQVWSYGQNNYPPLSHVHDPKNFSGSLHLQTLSWHCHEKVRPLQLSPTQSLLELHRLNLSLLNVYSSLFVNSCHDLLFNEHMREIHLQ